MNGRFWPAAVGASLFIFFSIPAGGAQPRVQSESIPFIYFGNVFLADPAAMDIRLVGSLSPAAPAVARAPAGRIWGRLDPAQFGALDPVTGGVIYRIALPFTAYDCVITPLGKAYVTHAAQVRSVLQGLVTPDELRASPALTRAFTVTAAGVSYDPAFNDAGATGWTIPY